MTLIYDQMRIHAHNNETYTEQKLYLYLLYVTILFTVICYAFYKQFSMVKNKQEIKKETKLRRGISGRPTWRTELSVCNI